MKTFIASLLAAASLAATSAVAEDTTKTTGYFLDDEGNTTLSYDEGETSSALYWDTTVVAETQTAYTLQFDVDLTNLTGEATDLIVFSNTVNGGTLTISFKYSSGTYTLTLGINGSTASTVAYQQDIVTMTVTEDLITVSVDADHYVSANLSRGYSSAATISAGNTENSLTFYTTSSTNSDAGTVKYSNVSITGSVAVVTAAVPEPATATLSLLALAGLAARRRRK